MNVTPDERAIRRYTEVWNDYVKPCNAGLASESRAVGRRIAKMLDGLGSLNRFICEGEIESDCWEFRTALIEKLRASGWRVSMREGSENFQVLPPKDKRFDGDKKGAGK
jgi:hypothetical protein